MPIRKRSATCAALICRGKLLADGRSQPLLAPITKSHKIVNTTCASRDAGNGWPCSPCRSRHRPRLRAALVTTFQLDTELVDNRPLLLGASDVDGFRGKVAARAFISSSSCLFDETMACRTGQARKAIGCVLTVMSRNIHRMSAKTKCAEEFQGAWPGLTSANLISFVRIGAHTTEQRKSNDQNENAKCCDNSFRRRYHAGVRSRSWRAWARRPLRFRDTLRLARSV